MRRLSILLALSAVLSGCGPTRPTAPAPTASGVALVAPTYTTPEFPLVPGWEPAGLGVRTVGILGPDHRMSYADPPRQLIVCVEMGPHQWDWEAATTRTVTVNGHRGAIRRGTDENNQVMIGLTWQGKDHRWVTVESFGALSESDLRRYAAGLRPGTLPGSAAPISFGLVPPGLVLQSLDDQGICLGPADTLAERYALVGICVSLASVTVWDPKGEELEVNGHRAILSTDGLQVIVDAEHSYMVSTQDYTLDRDTLIRVAAAVDSP